MRIGYHAYWSFIYNSQARETTQVPVNRGTDKEAVLHTYNGIPLSNEEEGNPTICNNIDGP